MKDVQRVVSDLKAAKSDCARKGYGAWDRLGGFQECLNDVSGIITAAEDIFSQLKSGNPDFSKLLADAEAIEDVATSAMDIVSQAKSGSPDFSQIIQDAQTIASDVVAAKSDCHFKKFDSFELGYGGSCEEDIEAIAQTALDLVQ